MNISEVFAQVGTQMRSDFDRTRASMTHAGLKGNEFERTFRNFLRSYLPPALNISTGQIVDSSGGISKQMDVVISDAVKTPVFYKAQDTTVVPVECVYQVIEVKANLTLAEVDSIFENMKSVKRLKKTAFLPESGPITRTVQLYGKDWPIWPLNYFVFAFEGADLTRIAQRFQDLTIEAGALPEARVDMICVLNSGVICNQGPNGKLSPLPSPSSQLFAWDTSKSLLLFYALASHLFNQAWLPSFQLNDYLREINFD